jgi:TRAP-type C4-dicarboxylate transport system permease small subunit
MMTTLLINLKKGLIKLLEWVVIILFAALVLDVLWGVLSRASGGMVVNLVEKGYHPWSVLPRGQTRWTEEVAIFLMMWVSLLGSSVAYGLKAHLGVDYVVEKLHPQAKALAEVVVHSITALFASAVLLWGGYELVTETVASGQLSPALNLNMGYVYLAVPISGAFIVLFCVENIVEILSGSRAASEAVK